MLLLAIESSTLQASVALATEDGVLASARIVRPRRHAEFCIPAIDFCLREAGAAIDAVSCVAVGLGPGLFTGMRVGIATAHGIARALRVAACGVSSLDVLAFGARFSSRTIVPVIDARRGEVYYALYRPVPGGVQRVGDYGLGRPEKLADELTAADLDVLLIGDGAHAYRNVFADRGVAELGDSNHRYPSATALAELAGARFQREEFLRPEALIPIYLRRPDAEINWEKAAVVAGGRV